MENLKSGGSIANMNGQILKDILKRNFEKSEFKVYSHATYNRVKDTLNEDRYVICNFPYKSIYGHTSSSTFLLVDDKKKRKLRIETKWQEKSGSVDEKYPYVYLNCVTAHEEDTILILEGDGYKSGVKTWLNDRITEKWMFNNIHKDFRVMNLAVFLKWFMSEYSE